MANGLYSRDEISRMTDSGLDELLCYYQDTGNAVGIERVKDELDARADDHDAELLHEAEEDERQILHDEMVDDMLTRDGRWG